MNIKFKIMLLPLIAIICTVLLVVTVNVIHYKVFEDIAFPKVKEVIIDREKNMLKTLVEVEAIALSEAIKGIDDAEKIDQALIEQTDVMIFFENKSGYFFIYDFAGNRINSPGTKGEAKTSGNYNDLQDKNGNYLIRNLAQKAKDGGGFSEYWFPKKGETEPLRKVAYSKQISGTDYYVGAGIYMEYVDEYVAGINNDITNEISGYDIYIYIGYVVYFLLLGSFTFFIIKSIITGISGIRNVVLKIANEGDVSFSIDNELLERKDEIGDLANASQRLITDFTGIGELASKLAKRDWSNEVSVKSEKDIMGNSLSAMIDEVNLAFSRFSKIIVDVDSGAHQISAASQALSQGATEQSASLEEITSSMVEMGAQTGKNAANAQEANQLANEANRAAITGQNRMQDLAEGISEITRRAEDTQKVVKTIDDIAFQTNLLALNAAVEAARAGVHGKGFAVVAEEVRNLAARSAKAAGETAELIDNVVKEVGNGNTMAVATAEALNGIAEKIEKSAALVADIATASSDQAQGVAQINIGLEQIDRVTQQNTASAEETASATIEMSSLAEELQKDISKFNLKENVGQRVRAKKRVASPRDAAVNQLPMKHTAAAVTPEEEIKPGDNEFGDFK